MSERLCHILKWHEEKISFETHHYPTTSTLLLLSYKTLVFWVVKAIWTVVETQQKKNLCHLPQEQFSFLSLADSMPGCLGNPYISSSFRVIKLCSCSPVRNWLWILMRLLLVLRKLSFLSVTFMSSVKVTVALAFPAAFLFCAMFFVDMSS